MLHECGRCAFRFTDFVDRVEEAGRVTSASLAALKQYVEVGLEANRTRIEDNAALVKSQVASGQLLDIGCGAGGFLSHISGYAKCGIELEPTRAEYCRRNGLDVLEKPLEDPCWDGRSFDAITLWDVIEHVNDPLGLVRRARTLLRPGGKLFIETPTRDGLLYAFGDWTARLTRGQVLSTMGVQYSAMPFGHKQIFRKEDMRRMLSDAGFDEVRVEEQFELSFPVDFYTRRVIKMRFLRRLVNPVASALLAILPVRNKMIVVASRNTHRPVPVQAPARRPLAALEMEAGYSRAEELADTEAGPRLVG